MAAKKQAPAKKLPTKKKKLSQLQWDDIEKRLLNGESRNAIAKLYGINESTIRTHFRDTVETVKAVANQMVATDIAVSQLTPKARENAFALFEKLRGISYHLLSAAEYGAMTAHRLSGIAHEQSQLISDIDPLGDETSALAIKSVSVLTSAANDSMVGGMALLKANAERIADMHAQEAKAAREKAVSSLAPDDIYKRMLNVEPVV